MAKVDTRSLSKSDLDAMRIKGVQMWQEGMAQSAVAESLCVRPATVHAWVKAFRSGGDRALITKKRGIKKTALTASQIRRLRLKIEGKTPGQLRLDFALWTTDAVLALIKELFHIQVSKRTVHRMLYAWGFTPKKATKRAWQQDFVQVQAWLTVEYPRIAQRAKRCHGRIFWADETGVRSDETTTVGWSTRGTPAMMEANGLRLSCNVISAIDNQGGLAFEVFKGSFNAQKFISFIKHLISHAKGRKVFLIVDQHPAHKAKVVQKWLNEHKKYIEMFFLPGYSPELNPDEYLNHDLKAQTVRKRPPANNEHLISMVRSHLRSRQMTPQKVARFFQAPSVQYAS